MRISHKHKFIFIAIPKCGSTSIRRVLEPFSELKQMVADPFAWNCWHARPPQVKKHFDEQGWEWDKYFKFTFTRNPWSRGVSMYHYRCKIFEERGLEMFFETRRDELGKVDSPELAAMKQTMKEVYSECSPENFRRSVREVSGGSASNMQWIEGCDYVGTVENMQQDFDYICNKIKIPRRDVPVFNTSEHKHYTDYYDDATREFVEDKHRVEIERFNFKYGE